MAKEEKQMVRRIFPKIRPILEEGEAIILLDESEKEGEGAFCKRVIVLNTGDDIKINNQGGYVSRRLYFAERVISLIAFVGIAIGLIIIGLAMN